MLTSLPEAFLCMIFWLQTMAYPGLYQNQSIYSQPILLQKLVVSAILYVIPIEKTKRKEKPSLVYTLTLYLLIYGVENSALEIHEMDLVATLVFVVINSEDDMTLGVIGRATICLVQQWFHPYRICFPFWIHAGRDRGSLGIHLVSHGGDPSTWRLVSRLIGSGSAYLLYMLPGNLVGDFSISLNENIRSTTWGASKTSGPCFFKLCQMLWMALTSF